MLALGRHNKGFDVFFGLRQPHNENKSFLHHNKHQKSNSIMITKNKGIFRKGMIIVNFTKPCTFMDIELFDVNQKVI